MQSCPTSKLPSHQSSCIHSHMETFHFTPKSRRFPVRPSIFVSIGLGVCGCVGETCAKEAVESNSEETEQEKSKSFCVQRANHFSFSSILRSAKKLQSPAPPFNSSKSQSLVSPPSPLTLMLRSQTPPPPGSQTQPTPPSNLSLLHQH